jgi:hypothetical protein
MAFDAKAFLATLTELPGVYRMLDAVGALHTSARISPVRALRTW